MNVVKTTALILGSRGISLTPALPCRSITETPSCYTSEAHLESASPQSLVDLSACEVAGPSPFPDSCCRWTVRHPQARPGKMINGVTDGTRRWETTTRLAPAARSYALKQSKPYFSFGERDVHEDLLGGCSSATLRSLRSILISQIHRSTYYDHNRRYAGINTYSHLRQCQIPVATSSARST